MSGQDQESRAIAPLDPGSVENKNGHSGASSESSQAASLEDRMDIVDSVSFPDSAVESAPIDISDSDQRASIKSHSDFEKLTSTDSHDQFGLPDAVAGTHDDGEGQVMSVVDHLDELRSRLIRSMIVFAVAMTVSFCFGREIIQILEEPARGMQFQALSIEEPVLVYFKVSFYAALVLAAPFLLFEVSAFVAPGLKQRERKVLLPVVLCGPLLFVLGAVFCYYLVLPPMFSFFNSFSGPIAPVQQRLDFYISLVTTMLFYMGICFQLPIVLFALSFAGIVNSRFLLSVWRYAVLISAVVAAIITPDPTVISMLMVMGALCGLYFFTVMLLKFFGR